MRMGCVAVRGCWRGSGEDGVLEAVRGVAVVGAGVWLLEAVRGCWRLLEG